MVPLGTRASAAEEPQGADRTLRGARQWTVLCVKCKVSKRQGAKRCSHKVQGSRAVANKYSH